MIRTAAGLAVLCGAVLAGAAGAVGAAAAGSPLPAALIAGGVAEMLVATGGFVLLLRRSAWRMRLSLAVAVSLVAASAVAIGVPPAQPPAGPQPVAGQAFWQLPSGSVLRYVHITAASSGHPDPVVFLHGGPGVADLAGDAAYFGQLADDGFDVYVYDELGAGGSTRLADPTGYGLHRDALDLEQIRRQIGAERLNLIGLSYGGHLAAAYLAAHPERVRRMVLLSPRSPDPHDTSAAGVQSRLDLARRLRTYAAVAAPRPLLAYALLQVNARDAHALFPDAEADARNDLTLDLAEPSLHCAGTRYRHTGYRASGFYRLQYPQSAAAPPIPDIRPRLAGDPTPTLIIKGQCDYLSWRSAMEYRRLLPRSELWYLRGAGHNVYQDQPAAVLAAIRAFLTGEPPVGQPYPGAAPPPDFQGPP
jgi:proline iminopeptidase